MLPKLYFQLLVFQLCSIIVLQVQKSAQSPIVDHLSQSSSLILHRSQRWAKVKPPSIVPKEEWGGPCGNSKYDNKSRRAPVRFRTATLPELGTSRAEVNRRSAMLRQLKDRTVVMRLNVVYDTSMANQIPANRMELFVRNLIYETQLYYELPEMYKSVRLSMVVMSLKRSSREYAQHLSGNQMLELFSQHQPDLNKKADLHILLIFRNFWDTPSDPDAKRRKILGMAYVGTFCQDTNSNTLLLNAASTGQSVVLAHEIAHSLNVAHDGVEDHKIESKCNDNSFIMSPSSSAAKLRWSTCSVTAITAYLVSKDIFKCVVDQKRINSAVPMNANFDFRPKTPRQPLPGVTASIDDQCKDAIGMSAASSLTRIGQNGDKTWETCQSLDCVLGAKSAFAYVAIGPAPSGSECTVRATAVRGRCYQTRCFAKQ